jgi:hypothetical protein
MQECSVESPLHIIRRFTQYYKNAYVERFTCCCHVTSRGTWSPSATLVELGQTRTFLLPAAQRSYGALRCCTATEREHHTILRQLLHITETKLLSAIEIDRVEVSRARSRSHNRDVVDRETTEKVVFRVISAEVGKIGNLFESAVRDRDPVNGLHLRGRGMKEDGLTVRGPYRIHNRSIG